jgi:hypothetical protein
MERLEVPGVSPSGVVHQDVDPAQRLGRRADEPVDLFGVADIAHVGEHLAAGRAPKLVRCPVDLVPVSGADGEVHALPGQLLGDGPAQALRAAGDDRLLAVQPQVHVSSPGS